MPTPSPATLRAFVRRQTRLEPVPDVPGVRLHTADDVMGVMAQAGEVLGQADPPLPFWAFPWAGGLAVARYVQDHPDEVASRHVVDVASGSGLCAIVAVRMGAASAQAVDIDPLAEAAVALNARANGVRIGFSRRDILGDDPPVCDVILAGDVCYEEIMAERMIGLAPARGRPWHTRPGRRPGPGLLAVRDDLPGHLPRHDEPRARECRGQGVGRLHLLGHSGLIATPTAKGRTRPIASPIDHPVIEHRQAVGRTASQAGRLTESLRGPMVGWQSPAPDPHLVGPQRAMDRIPSMARTSFSAPEAHIVVSTDGYFDVYPSSPRTNGDKPAYRGGSPSSARASAAPTTASPSGPTRSPLPMR